MDIYSQFRKNSFFKKFKALLKKGQNLDILLVVRRKDKIFYDSPHHLSSSPVSKLLKTHLFRNHFLRSINELFKTSPFKTVCSWRQTGLRLFTVPLRLKDSPLSACLACAVLSPRKEEKLSQALIYTGLSKLEARRLASTLKPLTPSEEEFIQGIMKLLGDDMFKLFQNSYSSTREKFLFRENLPSNFIMGDSPSMRYIFRLLKKIKRQDKNVLIEGEDGVGKTLLAKTIHSQSLKSKKAFHIQSFYELEERVLELELFGSVKKKKGGGRSQILKKSLLEQIDGGSLVLQGIENSSDSFQRRLLRLLKTGVYVYGKQNLKKTAQVRVFALSRENLKELVQKGKFDKNLYSVLSQIRIKIPPLKRRRDDIPLLSNWFLKQKSPVRGKKLSPALVKALCNYHWPENVRELEQEVAKLISLSTDEQNLISEQSLSPQIRGGSFFAAQLFQREKKQNLRDVLHSVEKQVLLSCLQKTNWNKSQTAKMIGASRTTVVAKCQEYGLSRKKAI